MRFCRTIPRLLNLLKWCTHASRSRMVSSTWKLCRKEEWDNNTCNNGRWVIPMLQIKCVNLVFEMRWGRKYQMLVVGSLYWWTWSYIVVVSLSYLIFIHGFSIEQWSCVTWWLRKSTRNTFCMVYLANYFCRFRIYNSNFKMNDMPDTLSMAMDTGDSSKGSKQCLCQTQNSTVWKMHEFPLLLQLFFVFLDNNFNNDNHPLSNTA